jgi:hypothetical protein
MECPFHAGNEAITACVQCETPICPMCADETGQVHLCLNCYRVRIEEFSASLGSASLRLAKERKKAETKAPKSRRKKEEVGLPPVQAAKPAYEMGATESLWEKEDIAPGEMAKVETVPIPAQPPVAMAEEPAPAEQPPSKKELARMAKEEAKRRKEEEKAAKKAGKAMAEEPAPAEQPPSKKELARMAKEEAKRRKEEEKAGKAMAEEPAAPAAIPEPAPFFEPAPEAPVSAPQPEPAPPQLPDIQPLDLPTEPPAEGIKLPRLDERLEFPPPRLDGSGPGDPQGMEPPEGFFD